jgi:hypothetical protein
MSDKSEATYMHPYNIEQGFTCIEAKAGHLLA